MNYTSTIRLTAAVLVTLALGALVGRAEVIEQVIVKVNGEIFTKTDLETRQVLALRQSGKLEPNANPTDAQLRALLDEVTGQLMVNVVDEILLVQRGNELGYKLSDEQFEGVVESLKKDNKIETEEQFQAALKNENMTLADLRKNLERQWMVERVRQNEILGKVGVTEDEARAYYTSHLSEFTTPAEVTLREIFVATKKAGTTATQAEDAAALQKATELRERVVAGESFEKLASEASDAPSRANAGLIGPLQVEEVSADLRRLLDQMKVGDVTQLLKTPNGYQILKYESRTEAKTTSFEDARNKISDLVFTDKRQSEFDRYLEKLRAQAMIEWKNDDVKKAYDRGLQELKAGI
jgi:parvulin-like peptidyl-prolyl isomerase